MGSDDDDDDDDDDDGDGGGEGKACAGGCGVVVGSNSVCIGGCGGEGGSCGMGGAEQPLEASKQRTYSMYANPGGASCVPGCPAAEHAPPNQKAQ